MRCALRTWNWFQAKMMNDHYPYLVAAEQINAQSYVDGLRDFGTCILDVVSVWNNLTLEQREDWVVGASLSIL